MLRDLIITCLLCLLYGNFSTSKIIQETSASVNNATEMTRRNELNNLEKKIVVVDDLDVDDLHNPEEEEELKESVEIINMDSPPAEDDVGLETFVAEDVPETTTFRSDSDLEEEVEEINYDVPGVKGDLTKMDESEIKVSPDDGMTEQFSQGMENWQEETMLPPGAKDSTEFPISSSTSSSLSPEGAVTNGEVMNGNDIEEYDDQLWSSK
ncbi:hypothetical protein SNEBB_008540 [Seison nebaliae]|nr:hypothetical protein SNEBB_008540 [Seison nebaliae]